MLTSSNHTSAKFLDQQICPFSITDYSTDFSTENMSTGIVQPEMKNPELGGSGQSVIEGQMIPSTIAHYEDLPASENLSFCGAEGVVDYKASSNRFCRIPDSLWDDQVYIDAPLAYQKVLDRCIKLAVFKPTEHNINGEVIELQACQLCYTIRHLAELCGKHVKRWDVERALAYFEKVKILRQEVRHKKTIITFIRSDICDCIRKPGATTLATKVRQKCDIKEEESELHKEERKTPKPPIASADWGLDDEISNSIDEFGQKRILKPTPVIAQPSPEGPIIYEKLRKQRTPKKVTPPEPPIPIVWWVFENYKKKCPGAKERNWNDWNAAYSGMIEDGRSEEDIKAVVTWILSFWKQPFCPEQAIFHPSKMRDRFEEYFSRKDKKQSTQNSGIDRRQMNLDGTPVINQHEGLF